VRHAGGLVGVGVVAGRSLGAGVFARNAAASADPAIVDAGSVALAAVVVLSVGVVADFDADALAVAAHFEAIGTLDVRSKAWQSRLTLVGAGRAAAVTDAAGLDRYAVSSSAVAARNVAVIAAFVADSEAVSAVGHSHGRVCRVVLVVASRTKVAEVG